MRTTINVSDELLRQAKQLAAETGTTLTAVIEDALKESLARRHRTPAREPVRLTTFGGRGTLPGVNLDDSAALLDLMEGTDAPPRR